MLRPHTVTAGPAPRTCRHVARGIALVASALLLTSPLASCGVPPGLEDPLASHTPAPPSSTAPVPTTPVVTQPPIAMPPPMSPAFSEHTAVACQGQPDGNAVISVLRRAEVLPGWATATVQTGPLCAGDWQYTELRIPEREPLLVVTQGPPAALTLIAAGTNVCTARVRAVAPTGIRSLACDAPSTTSAAVR